MVGGRGKSLVGDWGNEGGGFWAGANIIVCLGFVSFLFMYSFYYYYYFMYGDPLDVFESKPVLASCIIWLYPQHFECWLIKKTRIDYR